MKYVSCLIVWVIYIFNTYSNIVENVETLNSSLEGQIEHFCCEEPNLNIIISNQFTFNLLSICWC